MNMWIELFLTLSDADIVYAALLVLLRIIDVREVVDLVKHVIKSAQSYVARSVHIGGTFVDMNKGSAPQCCTS